MDMNDMVIISVDDHISEPPDMFEGHLSGEALASAPKMHTSRDGTAYWEYQGMKMPSIGLNAVVGRPFDEYGMEPTSLEQLRRGVYDVHARVSDMDVNGIAASLNFGTVVGFEGGKFHVAADKAKSLVHLRAYNDWHIDSWCAAYPERFIPCALLPTWDMAATVNEIARVAKKGCHAVSLNENPTKQGLPSIHNGYWEPMWKAIADHDMVICLHIGAGNPTPHASSETPIEAWITTMPMSCAVGAADWLYLSALQRYPGMKIVMSESGLGWVPYFMERADFSHSRHRAWTHCDLDGLKPSELFRKHFMVCFIDDAFGLQNLDAVNDEMVAYECDYPHSDTLWPEVPERLWATVQHLSADRIAKVTHRNAMRMFNFDPFKGRDRDALEVGSLRARAAAAGVDTKPRSSGGARPLSDAEARRRVTSGDVMRMFAQHAQAGK